jgi:hypothetical protein
MNIKVHYLITLCALFFLGAIIVNPSIKANSQNESRSCKLVKGKVDCLNKYSDYRINKNSEVQYNLN